ncbi:MAG: GAF domain-containing protein [Candidatus Izemoplasmatales bacterium]|nr:GAF domain-containing protein [Candidatus Izemoplasmatales bacterium]MDD4069091.1 GAF domain-containing protein [Candidatus Izemoplasmatales bacterium]
MNNEMLLTHAELFIDKKLNIITNLANLSAIIMENVKDLNWVGFYLYDGEKLYLGPFQGKAAVTLIDMGKGVCGTSAKERVTLVVDDVHKFPGHIPCDCDSNSEIVIPIIKNNQLFGVLDIDSPKTNRFDDLLKKDLETLVKLLVDIL